MQPQQKKSHDGNQKRHDQPCRINCAFFTAMSWRNTVSMIRFRSVAIGCGRFWKEFQSRHLNERVAIELPEMCSDDVIS